MSVPMSLEYSTDAVSEFLDYMSEKGLANKNTIVSRKAACSKMFEILDAGEMADVRGLNVSELAARFNNLKGTKYSPQSLQVYKSRVSKAVTDFLKFKEDPASFRPTSGGTTKSKSDDRLKKKRLVSTDLGGANTFAPTRGALVSQATSSSVQTINIPVALRPDCIMNLTGLPIDLSKNEAEKISAVVKAMIAVYED